MPNGTKAADPGAPIRIAIDIRPMAGPPCGYTIYLCSVINALQEAGMILTLLTNRAPLSCYPEVLRSQIKIFGANGDMRWEQVSLPFFLSNNQFDVYFSGANRGIPWRKNFSTRHILGLLDIIPFIYFKEYYLKRWRNWLGSPDLKRETAAQLVALARADAILTISEQSAADIRRVFRRRNVTANLIRLKDVARTPVPKEQRAQFVYVGGIDARKKVDTLLNAFALFNRKHAGYRLVLVGSNYTSRLPLIEKLGISDRVEMTGYVDHDTKFKILGESIAMIYPSLYEGYGLAIAEGFQAGLPVIAGRGGSQEEVGGNGVRSIDPSSPCDIVAAMEEMLDPATRAGWVMRGQQQLAILTDPAIETSLIAYFEAQARIARRMAAL